MVVEWLERTDAVWWCYWSVAIAAIAGGFVLSMAVMLDCAAALTAHVALCYRVAAALYRFQLNTLWSLWLLFIGKKRNVLRRRSDSCDYDMEQYTLGTILLHAALLPLSDRHSRLIFFACGRICRRRAATLPASSHRHRCLRGAALLRRAPSSLPPHSRSRFVAFALRFQCHLFVVVCLRRRRSFRLLATDGVLWSGTTSAGGCHRLHATAASNASALLGRRSLASFSAHYHQHSSCHCPVLCLRELLSNRHSVKRRAGLGGTWFTIHHFHARMVPREGWAWPRGSRRKHGRMTRREGGSSVRVRQGRGKNG